jgi:dihydroorotate dehydrogenase electron transfer subunit
VNQAVVSIKQENAIVVSNSEIMPGVFLLRLESGNLAAQAKPGQYVMIRCGENTVLPRPLSIHFVEETRIGLLFRIVGKGTSWLSQRRPGDAISVFGPLGNAFEIAEEAKTILLVGGGIGVAPLYFLAQEARNRGIAVILIIGAQNKDGLYPDMLLPVGIQIVVATEDGSLGHHGLVTDLNAKQLKTVDHIFACGPINMYKTMSKMPVFKKIPVQISLEVRMGCGRGLCYGCTIQTRNGLKKVCEEGPVFNLTDIMWDDPSFSHVI